MPAILAIILSVVGIIGALGGVWSFFKSNIGRNIIELQKTEIDTLNGKVTRLETDLATVNAERDGLREQVTTLKDLAQGSPQLLKIATEIRANTNSVNKLIRSLKSRVKT